MIFRNSEHYADPTAGKAIKNVLREEFLSEWRVKSGEVHPELGVKSGEWRSEKENWEDLANAAILQQAEDYRAKRDELRRIPKRQKSRREEIEKEILEIEAFFLSDWFCLLTNADGAVILDRLRKEVPDDSEEIPAAGVSA